MIRGISGASSLKEQLISEIGMAIHFEWSCYEKVSGLHPDVIFYRKGIAAWKNRREIVLPLSWDSI